MRENSAKKYFVFLIISTALSLFMNWENTITAEQPSTITQDVETLENIHIDVQANGDGFYCLRSDAEIQYVDNQIVDIFINDPTLFSFSVSSEYHGGVWLMNLDDGEQILAGITEVRNALDSNENEDLLQELDEILHILEHSGPYTNSST